MVENLVLVVAVLSVAVLGYLLGLAQTREELVPLSQSKFLAQKVQMYQVLVKQLESKLVQAEAQDLVLQSELDSAQVRVQDSELELVRGKERAQRAELALEEFRYSNQETDWRGYH